MAEPQRLYMTSPYLGNLLEDQGIIRRRDTKILRIGASFSLEMRTHFHSYLALVFDTTSVNLELAETLESLPIWIRLASETIDHPYPRVYVYDTLALVSKALRKGLE